MRGLSRGDTAESQPATICRVKGRGVTAKQHRFVAEYLVDLNGTQAAIRGSYAANSAEAIGRQLLRKTPVAAVLASAHATQNRRLLLTADEVPEQNAFIARLSTVGCSQHLYVREAAVGSNREFDDDRVSCGGAVRHRSAKQRRYAPTLLNGTPYP